MWAVSPGAPPTLLEGPIAPLREAQLTREMPTFTLMKSDGRNVTNMRWEFMDQQLIWKHVQPSDCVLMLGGNIGGACIMAAKAVRKPELSACVEPNTELHTSLEHNLAANTAGVRLVRGIVSEQPGILVPCNGVGKGTCSHTTTGSASREQNGTQPVASVSLNWLQERIFGRKRAGFTYMHFDCEGCACSFFKEYPDMLHQIRALSLEVDGTKKECYSRLFKAAEEAGLKRVPNSKSRNNHAAFARLSIRSAAS
jgi:FkbM family methyltransferase